MNGENKGLPLTQHFNQSTKPFLVCCPSFSFFLFHLFPLSFPFLSPSAQPGRGERKSLGARRTGDRSTKIERERERRRSRKKRKEKQWRSQTGLHRHHPRRRLQPAFPHRLPRHLPHPGLSRRHLLSLLRRHRRPHPRQPCPCHPPPPLPSPSSSSGGGGYGRPLPPPPPSSKALPIFFKKRPGFGTIGNRTKVLSNHFRVRFNPAQTIYHYDVTITPEPPKGLHRGVIDEAFKLYKEKFAGTHIAYDGQKSLFLAKPFPDKGIEMEFEYSESDAGKRRGRTYNVALREASKVNLQQLADYLGGRSPIFPQEALQALDLVVRQGAISSFVPRGRSFFNPKFGVTRLGGGLDAIGGFYQSIRLAQDNLLSLNIDIMAAPFIKDMLLPDFLGEAFNMDPRDLDREMGRADARGDTARARAKRLLKGIRIETTHNREAKRKYRIQGISNQPLSTLTFNMNEQQVSVVDYFLRQYNYRIILLGLPAIETGSKDKKCYLPMEVCRIVRAQPFMKVLNDKQKNELLGATCIPPARRLEKSRTIGTDLISSAYKITEEFGVQVNRLLTEIPARVLPSPTIKYQQSEARPGTEGVWNMKEKVMYQGCKIARWSLINFSPTVPDSAVNNFCRMLPQECRKYGVTLNPRLDVEWITETTGAVEPAIQHVFNTCRARTGHDLELLICVMPQIDNKSIYAMVKRTCEIELGVVSQCCLSDHVKKCNFQYLANLILKINTKLGGINAVLVNGEQRKLPLISSVPSIVIGADVSHPKVGDEFSPSIIAVAASMDWPLFSQYESVVKSQSQRVEILEEMFWEKEDEHGRKLTGGILKDLLQSFERRSGKRPQRIIYYRDGVSDGQFDAVVSHEMEAIKKACESLGWGGNSGNDGERAAKNPRLEEMAPKITFIVVQKRHHTKLFPQPNQPPPTRSGNIAAGTVVDTNICHPQNFDFYLCSHSGLKGTSKPAHYHVLKDENGFSADDIQKLTNDLCFTYVRCTRSVSVVPPCYYAHLAAGRARIWIDRDYFSDNNSSQAASTVGSRASQHLARPAAKPLPPLHDNIKRRMFYI